MNKLQEYLNSIGDKNKIKVISANTNYFKFSDDNDNNELVYGYWIGDLNLSQFPNLKRLELPVRCLSTPLTSLNLNNCANLEEIILQENKLNSLNFLNSLPNPEKLKELCINNNNLPKSDLTIFSKFTNLQYLNISDNNFTGSLQPLKDLNNLEYLNFKNTEIKEGLEYLPANLVRLSEEKYWGGDLFSHPVINCSDDVDKELKPLKYNLQAWRDANPVKLVFNLPNFKRVGLLDKETQTDLIGRDIDRLLKLEAQIQQPPK